MEERVVKQNYKKLYPTAFILYLSFFVHGFGAAILSQNTTSFQALWSTDAAGVLYVISALGIGRLITYPFSGAISDKFGRRLTVIIGCLVYICFFGGILIAPNVQVAFCVAILAGVANGFLDSGVIPAVMEILVNSSGLASILTKLVIAIAQYILPVMVVFWADNGMWFGWTFVMCIGLLVLIALLLIKLPFAEPEAKKEEVVESSAETIKANFWIEGVALIIMGYTATATFQVFLNINKDYGMTFLNMSQSAAGQIGSNYALGSICAVLLNVVLVKWFKSVRLILIYPALSLGTLLWMYLAPSPTVAQIGGFLIGATCAGGVLQLVVATMSDLFPASKAKAVSMIMIAGALCAFTITAIAGGVTKSFGVQYTLLVSAVLASVSIVAAIVVNIRYNILMKKDK